MNASVSNDAGLNRNLLRALLAAGALVLLWKLLRGVGTLFWTVFGLAVALIGSGIWRGWS